MFIMMTEKSKLTSVNLKLGSIPMNGVIGQNTLYSFSSSALNFQSYSEVLSNLLLKCTIHDTYEKFVS